MRRPIRLLTAVVLLSACGVDGPPRDVRVVSDSELAAEPDGESTAGSTEGEESGESPEEDVTTGATVVSPGGEESVDDPSAPGREDPPGSFGALHVPATVAVVGDSLTVAATDEITVALGRAGVRVVIVDGRESRRMATGDRGLPSGVAAIEDILAGSDPDLWVVALGTNDVAAEVATERFVADLRRTVTALPASVPVVWVDVWIRDRLPDVVAANALLRDELDRRSAPTLVVDWFGSAATEGLITGDGVHLTQTGQDRFASAITEAVLELGVSSG